MAHFCFYSVTDNEILNPCGMFPRGPELVLRTEFIRSSDGKVLGTSKNGKITGGIMPGRYRGVPTSYCANSKWGRVFIWNPIKKDERIKIRAIYYTGPSGSEVVEINNMIALDDYDINSTIIQFEGYPSVVGRGPVRVPIV